MTRFFDAVLAFPTALFTFLLLVAVGYWLMVLFSLADVEAFDAGGVEGIDAVDGGTADGGLANVLSAVGLGGAPVTVVLTVLIAVAWFLSLAGSTLVDGARAPGPLRLVVLPAAVVGGWLGARSMVVPIRRLLPDRPAPSRLDFVGRTCVVRTGEVSPDFGQAEVTADDGSTAIIQVRMAGYAAGIGWTGLIYDYDAELEAFWITPADPAR